jgi:rSAM-associated Gly-rich repeat protein
MPPFPSAGLLAFLLALPTLSLVVPPASEAAAAALPEPGPAGPVAEPAASPGASPGAISDNALPPAPGEAMEARLRRLSEAIRARSVPLMEAQGGPVEGEPWLVAGGWLNGNNRGWLNRGWNNRAFGGNTYRPPQVWANFRPSWRNFSNSPRFLNW